MILLLESSTDSTAQSTPAEIADHIDSIQATMAVWT